MKSPVPHPAVEAETGVLGSILLDGSRVLRLCDAAGIAADSFTVAPHPDLYRSILAVRAAGAPVDLLTLTVRLREAGRLDEIGGAAFLESLVDATPTAAHAEYYINALRVADDRRRLADWHRRAGERISKGDTEPGVLADELRQSLGDARAGMAAASTSCLCDDAAVILRDEPPTPAVLLADTFGPGDVVQINGASKSRKTFALLQLALCAVTGMPFLGLAVTPGAAVYLNLEIRPEHFRRRLWRMARALGIGPDLPHALTVLHGRGRTPESALAEVRTACRRTSARVAILDPVYKLAPNGEENASRDVKAVVAMMDLLAEDTGSAIIYAHHTPKGVASERAAVDRGAGHNTLSRAYDAALSILPHATEPDGFVCEWVLRNYAPRTPAAVQWKDDRFTLAPDLTPEPETTRSRQARTRKPGMDTDSLVDRASGMLADKPLPLATFKTRVQDKLGVGERRAREIVALVRERDGIAAAKDKPLRGTWYIGPTAAVERLVAR
jgi:hypothetical protein